MYLCQSVKARGRQDLEEVFTETNNLLPVPRSPVIVQSLVAATRGHFPHTS